MIITYYKRISNDARNAEAAAKLESHVNVEVGWESNADAKQQQEEVWEQDHEAPTKPTKRKIYIYMFMISEIRLYWCMVEFEAWTLTCTCRPWGPTPAHQKEGQPCRWTATLQPGCSYHTPGWTDRGEGQRKETTTHWDLLETWNLWTLLSRADVFL